MVIELGFLFSSQKTQKGERRRVIQDSLAREIFYDLK